MINYLTTLVRKGLSYSSITTAKSAISTINSLNGEPPLGKHPLVQRFLKGVYNSNPPTPRYTKIWDVGLLIKYFKDLGHNKSLELKHLSYKLVALIAILSASRVNYIASLSVEAMDINDEVCIFYPTKLLKTSRPNFLDKPIRFTAYHSDDRLCVVKTLREYLQRRTLLTKGKQLFISFRKPHLPVHKDTIARWLKTVLLNAGVDTTIFSAHSYRLASTSKADVANIPITDILKQGQWSSEKTWINHYRKDIVDSSDKFAEAMLQQ